MFDRFRLSTRIALIGILTTLSFAAALPWIYIQIRSSYYESRWDKITKLVNGAWGAIDYYGKQASAGTMTKEQAQEAARQTVRSLRYGPGFSEAFWINDLTPHMVMNTSSPQLEGKDLSNTKDPQGIYIFQEMIKVCKESGAGRVAYMWPKSGGQNTEPAPKFNYVKLYEPWGWIVGTGIYVDDVEEALHRMAWILFGVAGLACALAAFLTFAVVRSISRPVQEIAAGLASASDQVQAGSAQVSQASQALAHDASAQAAALEQTSASSQEISSMARRNAENSEGSSRHMSKTSQAVAHANQRIAEMTGSMSQIEASSDKISKIIKVIDEIAFQTNILALNAAVEAARAGEAGMGFAVVADEVRNLAQRSAQAAQDTAALIEDSIHRTKDGAAKLEQVAQSIGEITESSKAVGILVDEVHMGSQEQAQGIDQIAKALTQMEQLTQRAAAGAEESAAASEELNAQSVAMKESVRRLGILITGSRGVSSARNRREWNS